MLTTDSIAIACAKPLEDFERDYMPPRSSYGLYTTVPKSPEVARSYKLNLHKPSTLRPEDLTACLKLIEKTSGRHYRGSKDGWNARKKRKEMELFDLRYLVIREVREVRPMSGDEEWEDVEVDGPVKVDEEESVGRNDREAGAEKKELFVNEDAKSEGEIKGFMSFMPTYEDGIKVVYLYEIHLIDELRGTGLGTHLMTLLANVAHAIPGVKKTMLTCFTANKTALNFYEKLGYEKDEYSPEPKRLKGGRVVESDYVILSRRVEGKEGEKSEEEEEEREVGRGKRKRSEQGVS